MHGAPSVSYPVGRSLFGAGILLAAWTFGSASCAWWWWSGASGWRLGAALIAVAATGIMAAWWWRRQPEGLLGWDGGAWTWAGDGRDLHEVGIHVEIDLQAMLLLRWHAQAGSGWFWLERRSLPQRWDALRRAVYSRANPAALPGAEPPSARS